MPCRIVHGFVLAAVRLLEPPVRRARDAVNGAVLMFDRDELGRANQPALRWGRNDGAPMIDIAHLVGKWFFEFAAVLSLVIAGGLAYIGLVRAPVFESEARLFVRVSQEQTPPQTMRTRDGVTFMPSSRSDVASEIDLLLSGAVFERVVDATGLDSIVAAPAEPATFTQRMRLWINRTTAAAREQLNEILIRLGLRNRLTLREAVVEQLRRSVAVAHSRESNVIIVTLRWGAREAPQWLLQQYLDAFLDFRLIAFSGDEPDYFSGQLLDSRAAIDAVANRQHALRERWDIHAIAAQRDRLIGRLSTTRAAAHDIDARAAVVAWRLEAFARDDAEAAASRRGSAHRLTLANIPENSVLSRLDDAAIAAAAILERLDAQGLLRTAEGEAAQREFALVRETTVGALRDLAGSLAIEKAALEREIDELGEGLAVLSAQEAEWRSLERELEVLERSYRHFAERLDEAREIEELRSERIGNVIVLQPPTEARFATNVRNARLLAVIGVFGFLAALVWVSGREVLDDRVHRARDLEDITETPPLAVLPPKRRSREWTAAVAMAAARLRGMLAESPSGQDRAAVVVVAPASVRAPGLDVAVSGLAAALVRQRAGRVLLISVDETAEPPVDAEALHSPAPDPAGFHRIRIAGDAAEQALVDALVGGGDTLNGWGMVLVSTPPMKESEIALRTVLAARRVLLLVGAGRETRTAVADVSRNLAGGPGQLLGSILCNARGSGA